MTEASRLGRRRPTSLRTRLRRALVTAAVVLALVVGAAAIALAAVRERQHEVVDLYFGAVTQADAAYIQLVDAETAVRGYALTGDRSTLAPFERLGSGDDAAVDEVQAELERTLGADHAVLAARDRATASARRWYAEFALPTIELVETGGPGSVTAADVEAGRVLFDDLRGDVERYQGLLRVERAAAVAGLRDGVTVLVTLVGVLAVASVAVGVLLWVFLRRWVTDPLSRLADDARAVAAGDTEHELHETGPGEVGEVGRAVGQMRSQLAGLLAEAALQRAELEESHARLESQAEDLRRSNRDLEQFAYVASHDLQEPLRKVASFTQLLAKRYEGQLDERADQYIGFAVDGAKRMQRLINDLLGFSRVGRVGGEVTDVDLGAALEQVVADLDETIEAAGARVVGHDLPVVRGEGPLLTQLLANLVGNALKFRRPDVAPEVHLEARRTVDAWELSCSDNGIGIDPRYAERVFVIFQRLHPKDVYEGTGIGLALCKKIVEYHGGEIWIAPPEGERGTTIRWTLPVDPSVTAGRGGDEVAARGADRPLTGKDGTGAPTGRAGAAAAAPPRP